MAPGGSGQSPAQQRLLLKDQNLGCCKKEEGKRGSGGQWPPAGQGRALPGQSLPPPEGPHPFSFAADGSKIDDPLLCGDKDRGRTRPITNERHRE